MVWLRADTLVDDGYANNTGLTAGTIWRDRTSADFGFGDGIAQDATHTNGGPTLRYTDGPNGQPIVGFGNGGGLDYVGSTGVSGSDFATFIVARYTGSGNADHRAFQIGTHGTPGEIVGFDLATPAFRYNNGNNQFADDPVTGTFHIASFFTDPSDTYATGEYLLDGIAGSSTAVTNGGNVLNLADTGYAIGRGTDNNGNARNYANAEIAEVLLFNRSLAEPEINSVLAYLSDRYALETAYVPEPSRALLLIGGFAACLLRRRR
ncbi:MAG: PEP-CTERM sorting domain-containing protein [Verrucomicrobiales bacterium]